MPPTKYIAHNQCNGTQINRSSKAVNTNWRLLTSFLIERNNKTRINLEKLQIAKRGNKK